MPIEFENVSPILRVANLAASLQYYVDVLGFRIDWQAEGPMAAVSRDRCAIMLTEHDQGHPGSWVWLGVGDAEALHADYVARGAKIRLPPTNYSWAMEIRVEDLDGNVLRLGSEPKEDREFADR